MRWHNLFGKLARAIHLTPQWLWSVNSNIFLWGYQQIIKTKLGAKTQGNYLIVPAASPGFNLTFMFRENCNESFSQIIPHCMFTHQHFLFSVRHEFKRRRWGIRSWIKKIIQWHFWMKCLFHVMFISLANIDCNSFKLILGFPAVNIQQRNNNNIIKFVSDLTNESVDKSDDAKSVKSPLRSQSV